MATTIPEALKSADITRFVTRASQVEKAKPAVAYWCYYWVVQQIVTRNLHNTNDETMGYTLQLMEKLETAKATDNDAIKDEVAAQALIEQFGLDVFSRADNAVRANKASRQTADTFQAAYTFLELMQIWPPLDAEITSKIKYAKYHALRIAKAVKAGEDPNLSNPVPEPEPEINKDTLLDPNDPEVRAIQGDAPTHQASVEDVPDDTDHMQSRLAATSNLDQSIHPSRDTSVARAAAPSSPYNQAENYYQTSKDVSPIGPPSNAGPPSIGGGYFPRVSDEFHSSPGMGPTTLPSAPADIPETPLDMSPVIPPAAPVFHQPKQPTNIPPPQAQQTHFSAPTPQAMYSSPNPAQGYAPVQAAVVDDQAMVQAQKHARWAISALNFEDVETAVKELRGALEQLGARGPW